MSQGVSNVLEGRNFFTGIPKFTPTQAAVSATKAAAGEMSLDEYKDLVTKNPGAANANSQAPSTSANPGATQYPPHDGFDMSKPITTETLKEGQIITRFGKTSDGSRFFSPDGVKFELRSLNIKTPATVDFSQWRVLKPFDVKSGVVAPWFGQPGGGVQYVSPMTLRELENRGFVEFLSTVPMRIE